MDDSPNLPTDLIFESLSRTTSLKTLDTCKLVCKDWNQLVHESSFMPEYCKNTDNLYGYYVQNLRSCKHVQQFVSLNPCQPERARTDIGMGQKLWGDDIKIEASSKQGILCVVRRKSVGKCRYYVCKPCTGQWQVLPNPKLRFLTVKVALVVYHSNPLRYKIVRISRCSRPHSVWRLDCYDYCCEIFDSKTWQWRRANDILLPYGVFFEPYNQSVYATGMIYWLTTDGNVLAFNHEQETHLRFPLPDLESGKQQDGWSSYSYKQLIDYGGKLGFIYKAPEEQQMELWVLDDWKDHASWRLNKEVNIEPIKLKEGNCAMPVGFYNKDIVLLKAWHTMLFYKLQDCSISKAKLEDLYSCYAEDFFPFRSDLEPINLRGG